MGPLSGKVGGMVVTVNRMQAHVIALAKQHRISINFKKGCFMQSFSTERRIEMQPIKSRRLYVTALHEIGHCVLNHKPDQHRKWKEIFAWRWARLNSIIEWTPRIEAYEDWCLSCWGINPVDKENPSQYLLGR